MNIIVKTILVALAIYPLASHAQERFGKWVLLQDGNHCMLVQDISPSADIADITPEQLGAFYGKVVGSVYRGQDPSTVTAGHEYTIGIDLSHHQFNMFIRGNADSFDVRTGYITVNGQKNEFDIAAPMFPEGGGEIRRILTTTNPSAIAHADRVTFEIDDIPYALNMDGFLEAAHNYKACMSAIQQ